MGMYSLGAATAQDEVFRHGIETALAQRLAAQDAPRSEDAAARGPEARYGNPCIIGTGWMKAAACPEHRAQPPLVEGQQE